MYALIRLIQITRRSYSVYIVNLYIVSSGVRRKLSWGFIQWLMVVICIWCALFVTSQFDVIFMFPIQRFGEVC